MRSNSPQPEKSRCANWSITASQELVDTLDRIPKQIHAEDAEWAQKGARRILRALQAAKDKKLRDQHYAEFTRSWKERKQSPIQSPGIKWATHLISLKLKKKHWGRGAKPLDKVLSEIETRAAQILSGSRSKSRKNFVEDQAEKLADEVRQEWLREWSPPRKTGRPFGGHAHKRLSLEEIVSVAIPIIEEMANAKLKVVVSKTESVAEITSPTFAALVAVINTQLPGNNIESIAKAVARVRSRTPKRTTC
jgi:hypothetical protein